MTTPGTLILSSLQWRCGSLYCSILRTVLQPLPGCGPRLELPGGESAGVPARPLGHQAAQANSDVHVLTQFRAKSDLRAHNNCNCTEVPIHEWSFFHDQPST